MGRAPTRRASRWTARHSWRLARCRARRQTRRAVFDTPSTLIVNGAAASIAPCLTPQPLPSGPIALRRPTYPQCTRTRERAPRQRQCDGRPYLRAGEYHTHARDRRRRYTDAIRLDDPRYIVEISELSMLWRAVDISKAQTGRGRYLALSKPSSGEITIAPAPRHPCRGKWPRSFPFSGGIARDLDRPLQWRCSQLRMICANPAPAQEHRRRQSRQPSRGPSQSRVPTATRLWLGR